MEQRMHIRQLAEKLRTSPRAIRFYEEKGLISPEKDPRNRYRLFSERDAWRLQTILALREVGMPVRAVKRVLEVMDKGENSGVRRYLELQRSAMFFEWIRLREMIVTRRHDRLPGGPGARLGGHLPVDGAVEASAGPAPQVAGPVEFRPSGRLL